MFIIVKKQMNIVQKMVSIRKQNIYNFTSCKLYHFGVITTTKSREKV